MSNIIRNFVAYKNQKSNNMKKLINLEEANLDGTFEFGGREWSNGEVSVSLYNILISFPLELKGYDIHSPYSVVIHKLATLTKDDQIKIDKYYQLEEDGYTIRFNLI